MRNGHGYLAFRNGLQQLATGILSIVRWANLKLSKIKSWASGGGATEADILWREQLSIVEKANWSLQESLRTATSLEIIYKERNKLLEEELTKANSWGSSMEQEALDARRECEEMKARVGDLQEQIGYLKNEVKIYQTRLGLLPQERQGQMHEIEHKPLKAGRVPFAIAASRAASQRTEEYWRARAAAAEPDTTGTTGATSTDTSAVSDKA